MIVNNIANKIITALGDSVTSVNVAPTGSVYIHTNSDVCKLIRVSNHKGHKPKRKTWELRSDVMSVRRSGYRIYNSVNALVSDFDRR